MDPTSSVVDHYSSGTPFDRIMAEFEAKGIASDELTTADLSGVDEFHLGGRIATLELIKNIDVGSNSKILDVGCGIGGVSRTLAQETGCTVTGVDLTPAFVSTARRLSELVDFETKTQFDVADATALDFADDSFDVITLVHVGMNIADKRALFTELARVLRPGGSIHVYDIMRVGEGELTYPMPWASDASCSFVAMAGDYRDALAAAGLLVDDPANHLELVRAVLAGSGNPAPVVNLSHLMGENWPTMIGNLLAALNGGMLAPTEIVARAH